MACVVFMKPCRLVHWSASLLRDGPQRFLDTVSTDSDFFGAFAKLRKAGIFFVMSVRLSEWNNSAPTRRIFMKFNIWVFIRKSVEKIQILFKSGKNNWYFT